MDEVVGNISDLPRNADGSFTIPKVGVWQFGTPLSDAPKGRRTLGLPPGVEAVSAIGLPMDGHVEPHQDATGLCQCPCEDCTTRLTMHCVCADCRCESRADHGVDVQLENAAVARYLDTPPAPPD